MRIYHGWFVVAATTIVYMLVIGAVHGSFGVYVIPISHELNIPRATMNMALTATSIGNMFLSPLIGRAVDRYPARNILIVASMCLGAGFTIIGLSSQLWIFALAMGIFIPIGINASASLNMVNLVLRWFTVHRIRALVFATIGVSAGTTVVPPIAALLIEWIGWRLTLICIGMALMALLVVIALFLREAPGPDDIEPGSETIQSMMDGLEEKSEPLGVGQALRSNSFWILASGPSLALGIYVAYMASFVPIAVDSGISTIEATGLFSSVAVSGICAKLAFAYFGDAVNRLHLLLLILVSAMLMCIGFLVSLDQGMLFICGILLGFGFGLIHPVIVALTVDIFGRASFGTVTGFFAPITAICSAVTLRIAGEAYDRTGSYQWLHFFALGLLLIAVLIVFPLRKRGRYTAK